MSDSLLIRAATEGEAAAVAGLQGAAARALTERFGPGHWSHAPGERAVASALRHARVVACFQGGAMVATFRLSTRKPWAIDASYFTPVERPLYLTDMAVEPALQRGGIGRACLAEAVRMAEAWPAGAIRLDAYDAEAGAAGFYERCGFRRVGRATYRGNPLVYLERRVAVGT